MEFLFKSSGIIPIIEAAKENNEQLIFVRDHGVYLMVSVNDKNSVCYAENCNPHTNEDWYDISRGGFDGDDFGEYLDQNIEVFNHVINLQLNLKITIDGNSLILSAVQEG